MTCRWSGEGREGEQAGQVDGESNGHGGAQVDTEFQVDGVVSGQEGVDSQVDAE